jgi:hypothetical protein
MCTLVISNDLPQNTVKIRLVFVTLSIAWPFIIKKTGLIQTIGFNISETFRIQ